MALKGIQMLFWERGPADPSRDVTHRPPSSQLLAKPTQLKAEGKAEGRLAAGRASRHIGKRGSTEVH